MHHRILPSSIDSSLILRRLSLTALLLACSSMALAHSAGSGASGFMSGLLHPMLGWDHVAAMIAVGLWGALLGRPAMWILPIAFPLVMVLGGTLGVLGIGLPGVEFGIALSALILGALIALAVRLPLVLATVVVGGFAVFHGHAHGTELPAAASPVTYCIGFVLATAMLHLVGMAMGQLLRLPQGNLAIRASGGLIALAGVGFLTGIA